MNLPIIRATTCPSEAELSATENAWAIVRSTSGRAYVGRVEGYTLNAGDRLTIHDPFDYFSKRELAGDPAKPDSLRLGMMRQVYPVEHWDVASISVAGADVVWLSMLSPKALEALRVDLVGAWEGRAHLRKHGGRLQIAQGLE